MKELDNSMPNINRALSAFISLILALMTFFPYLPSMQIKAADFGNRVTLTTAHGDFGGSHKLYCIDKGGLAIWGIADDGDQYECHKPSDAEVPLTLREQEYIFWGLLSLQSSLGIKEANSIISIINNNAQAQGKATIGKPVTEEDLKALIYMSSVRNKYPWLEKVASNTEEYLKMAGLIGGNGGSTQSGRKIPTVIANHTSLTNAYQISLTDFTIQFDEGGADSDFIKKVPIYFSNNNGTTFEPSPTDGWTYTKTSNSIIFSNPNPEPPKAMIKFITQGTEYESKGGTFTSGKELIDECLQIWECLTCSGKHTGGTPPYSEPWFHQRMVWLEIPINPVDYYAALAGAPTTASGGGEITFQVFRHEEDFTSHYNVQLYKYDYETGKPLENARFVLYERFDDKGEININRDGPVHIYKGGKPYASYHKDNPVIWDGFRKVGSIVTDSNGHSTQAVSHGYHYDKTFCDGHPSPVFVAVPEPETDDGEDGEEGETLNGDEIEAAKARNRELAQAWLDCVSSCEEQADGDFEGVHFHWVMVDVHQSEIQNIADSGGLEGTTPDGGNSSEPDADTAYEESGCHEDMQSTYDKFISLKYSYAITEFQARDGYIRHDLHADDIPIEIITTTSSEDGAKAAFSGEYSSKEYLESEIPSYSARSVLSDAVAVSKPKSLKLSSRITPERRYQRAKAFIQEIVSYLIPNPAIFDEPEGEMADLDENLNQSELEMETIDDSQEINIEMSESEVSETDRAEAVESEAEESEAVESEAEETEAEESETEESQTEKSQVEEEKGEAPIAEISSRPLMRMHNAYVTKPDSTSALDFEFIDEDGNNNFLKINPRTASPSDATPSDMASPSEASFEWPRTSFPFRNPMARDTDGMDSDLFPPAYEEALAAGSSGENVLPGPAGNYSHCNHADGEGNAWRIYDHRTEGEFHINKKDLDLSDGETEQYGAYGDTQGDSSLEGAVYGLFAAQDLAHPDGKTGAVYKANNLVAIASTDKNGDASFLACTEAPGRSYDYVRGTVVNTADGWADIAPENLFKTAQSIDDYSGDGQYERTYRNNQLNNGNCWIGRPLLMGDYYIKELARSEGYELSIGEKANAITNREQDPDVKAPGEAEGYAVISSQIYADEQTSEDGAGAGPNELFFAAISKDTKDQKYDIILTNLPERSEFYRKEEGSKQIEVQAGTGTYETILLTNQDGSPKYIRAEHDYQYPKYNPDGSLMTREVPINYVAKRFRQVSVRTLNESVIQAVLNRADASMTEEENRETLNREYSSFYLPFVKGKVETALRKNGKATPKRRLSDGSYEYSSIYAGVFDSGVRKGDYDPYGLSGVTPGSSAAYTVYGSPVQKIVLEKKKPDGTSLTAGDAILSILNYYDNNPFYSYGGIDAAAESATAFTFTIYAGVTGNPDNFMVLGSDPETDSIICHSVPHIPGNSSLPPRLIYAFYSNNPDYDAFGTYEDYQEGVNGSSVVGRATLITDAAADQDGNLHSKETTENVYYQTGELVRDSEGNLIRAFTYREITKTEFLEVQEIKWHKIPAVRDETGAFALTVEAAYTDAFGASHSNSGVEQTILFKAVLEEKKVALTAEEAAMMGAGFQEGHPMDSASYYVHVRKARAKAYPDYRDRNLAGDNTYVVLQALIYPGQTSVYQDAGTRLRPVPVQERVIRQKIKVVKDILTMPDGTYADNTNADSGHEDQFTTGPGGAGESAAKLPGFRFKLYLKSNLERLYRDEEGQIRWLDRHGNEVDIDNYRNIYPETEPFGNVQKLFTKVLHKGGSLTSGSVSNNVWDEAVTANRILYSYDANGLIHEKQNPGDTRLLETVSRIAVDGVGNKRLIETYNYEKFYDAIYTANHDKWDRKEDGSTSFKPFAGIRERIFGTSGGEKEYPASHNNRATENQINSSEEARENAKRSDAVRQFAITWYLDDEVKKLTKDNEQGENQAAGGSESYQDEIYDRSLYKAIRKAENYLSPFFNYDLDEIYAIAWDSEADGGPDGDKTTLAADTLQQTRGGGEPSRDGYYYGVSKYLPYGTYIAVEQQPYSAEQGDFPNKHYKTDKPKEIILPSVYETGGNDAAEELYSHFYEYNSKLTPEESAGKYRIRMNEEWADTHTDDLRGYVIRAQNNDGDFEIFKYGMSTDRLNGTITYPGGSYNYNGFHIVQEAFKPYKDVYASENAACVYRSNQTVGKYYHYASLSEQAGTADQVMYPTKTAADDNNSPGFIFRDGVKTITGSLTGYDGIYCSALVPWTVTDPVNAGIYEPERFTGFADGKYRNTFYTTRLRIEKLDSETGENILHDGAIFTIYSAKREDGDHSDGLVKFYERDTVISGSKEFLESMGATDITPLARPSLPWQIPYMGKYYGTVVAGTPICLESEQVIMSDEAGEKTGRFRAYTTTKDRGGEGGGLKGSQNTGYLEAPQPLGAGCYVLCEVKAPSGYVRSKPVAVEIYSDETTYYLNGNKDNRVAAAIYEEIGKISSGTSSDGSGPQGALDVARIYLNNTPIRLEITKAKPDEKIMEYELNGRLEGSLTQLQSIYGLENLELAYNASGTFLLYGWKKGFLDSLRKKQQAGETVEILYEDGVFTGRAKLYKELETGNDENRYLPGAVMTLYDAIEVKPNGDREDFQFDGVNVGRDRYGNVTNIFVQKGFAGTMTKFVLDKSAPGSDGLNDYQLYTFDDQEDDRGAGTWNYKTVEREDTDILFFDLGGLSVLQEENGTLYGHDKEGKRIQAINGEPIYAMKNGNCYLEIVCPDYKGLKYSSKERVFEQVPKGTNLYHLDADGNRDSQVNPYTGMAYVKEESNGKILVWPVKTSWDQYGNRIAVEKITTGRIATFLADTEEEWTIGTYEGGVFKKTVNPVLNEHGLPDYYQQSEEQNKKGKPVYDRDGDYVRYQYDDMLKNYNDNAWKIDTNRDLRDIGADPENPADDRPLYRRQGESFIIPNTWITGEAEPDNPFRDHLTEGKVDVLKRVPAGLYIMEELKAPDGYVKTMPVGLTVEDKTEIQAARATDRPISGYFDKLDAPGSYRVRVRDRNQATEEPQYRTEGKAGYTYGSVNGAGLALFRARRVAAEDTAAHPSGYYLEKTEEEPASWTVLDTHNKKKTFTAAWETGGTPKYLEAIPKGYYILEETKAPSGFVPSSMEIEIKEQEGLQYFILYNDHTKLEFYKYLEADDQKTPITNDNPAEFALYEATAGEGETNERALPIDRWTTDDCREYTSTADTSEYLNFSLKNTLQKLLYPNGAAQSGFTHNYERSFREYGTGFDILAWETERLAVRERASDPIFRTSDGHKIIVGSDTFIFEDAMSEADRKEFMERYAGDENALTVSWLARRTARLISSESTDRNESVRQIWEADTGNRILISAEKNMTPEGEWGYIFDYKFNYRAIGSERYPNAVSYDTPQGNHRIDYLAAGRYKLVELKAPEGFEKSEDRIVNVEETADIQLYSVENRPHQIYVEKLSEDGSSLAGAELSLYRSDSGGYFSQLDKYLEDTWITGDDGYYTMEDYYEGRIPDGFLAGEMKPHRLRPLAEGIYYLAETKAPEGFELMKPQRIKLPAALQEDEILRFTAVNRIKTGELIIEKTSSADSNQKLPGAKFEVRNCHTGEMYYLITDENGRAKLTGLKTGCLQEGKWVPCKYTIRELAPPDQYALSTEIKTFYFSEAQGEETPVMTFWYGAINEPTDIVISKSDFYTGEFVKGARLAIYKAAEEGGVYVPAGEPLDEWISDGNKHRITGKLSAGGVYFLKELIAPDGYAKAPPMMFVLSDDGRKINIIQDSDRIVKIRESGSSMDALESIFIQGRKAVKTEVLLTETTTGKTLVVPSYQSGGLTEADGLVFGRLYEEKEITSFTDQNVRTTRRQIFRPYPDERGEYRPSLRTPEKTIFRAETDSQGLIEEWEVENREGWGYNHVIYNPEYEEKSGIEVSGTNGKYGSSVRPGSVVRYELTCKNTGKEPKNIQAAVCPDQQTEFMPANSDPGWVKTKDGMIALDIPGLPAGAEKKVTVTVAVKETAEKEIVCSAEIGGNTYRSCNPVAGEGSLAIVNRLTGTAADRLENRRYLYQVELSDESGQPLKGTFNYSGSSGGRIKSGDPIELMGGGSIVIKGIPWNTTYEVTPLLEEEEGNAYMSTGTIGPDGKSAVFMYRKNDGALRDKFRKGDTCHLTEVIRYSDGSEQITGKLTFLLDESAAAGGLDMKDRPVRVLFSKTDITGETELPGAHFRLRDEEGNIVEEWISDGSLHETEALLKPGGTYILEEITPPEGFAAADEIRFTVSEDGTVDLIRVSDRPTRIIISKISAETEAGLAGAVLEITDEEDNRIDKWTSDGKPHLIEGRLIAGKTYTLRELSAPPGYRKAEPVQFTVSDDGSDDIVVMEDMPTRIYIEKIGCEADKITETGKLKGALIRIEDQSGKEVYRFLTDKDSNHEVTGVLQEGETYRAVEEEAPYGYEKAEPVIFTVPEDGEIITVRMVDIKKEDYPPDNNGKDKTPEILIHKYDGVTLCALEGAEFAIYRSDGSFLTTVRTGKDGRAALQIHEPGTYTAVETKAPPGYQPSLVEYSFTIKANDAGRDEISVPNYPEVTEGLITVYYDRNMAGRGNIFLEAGKLLGLPKAGDSGGVAGRLILFVIFLVGIGILWLRKRKRNQGRGGTG